MDCKLNSGSSVSDLSDCSSISLTTAEPARAGTSPTVLVGAIVGGVLALIIIFIIVMVCLHRRRQRARQQQINKEELEDMLPEIIKRSRKDENYCKKGLYGF